MWLYAPSLVLALAMFIYWYITRTFNYFKKRNIAYREPVPLFGNIKESALRRIFKGHIYRDIYHQFPNEKVVGVFRMTTPAYMIRDPDFIKLILVKDFDNFADKGFHYSKEKLGSNVAQADEKTWRVLRKNFTPLFSSGKLKNMYHLIVDCGDRLIDFIEETQLKEKEIIFLNLARKFTMSSLFACVFGIDIDYKNPETDVLDNFDRNFAQTRLKVELDYMFPGILSFLNLSFFPTEVKNYFYDVVRTVCEQRNNMPGTRNDLMDLILEMKQQKTVRSNKTVDDSEMSLEITDDIIAAQAFIFFLGGVQTSSNTASFLMFELLKNPDVQQKLLDEIDNTLQRQGGKLSYDAISDMPYLSNVFDETLRKYALVDTLTRVAREDYNIPGTEITIQKGQTVLIPVHGLHSDEKYYPNPEKFIPERFTPENASKLHSCCYLPFGAGPRNCIGIRFGKVQTKVLVVKLLSKYRVEPVEKLPDKVPFARKNMFTAAEDGVPLKLIPRH